MATVLLLGDSILDNGSYVAEEEPDVAAQIRAHGHEVEMRAVDGHMVADVVVPSSTATLTVLSVGGNDALDHMGLLTDPEAMPFAAAMARLRQIREGFRPGYAALLARLPRPALVLTIYNPNFAGSEAAAQGPAEGALSAFNDVILSEALHQRIPVLDLRRLFTDPAAYANPIEPSARGGAKIAAAIDRHLSAISL